MRNLNISKIAMAIVVLITLSLSLNPIAAIAGDADNYDSYNTFFQESSRSTSRPELANWSSWGHDILNSRFNIFETKVKNTNAQNLTLKWSFVFPDTLAASSQPAIVGDTLYVGSWNAKFYALNAKTGQVKWVYDTFSFTGQVSGPFGPNAVRDGPAVADGKVFFGDIFGNIYALNANTGALVWAKRVDTHFAARLTGSPIVWQGRVYFGVSSTESGFAVDPSYPCCTFRGSVAAFNTLNGAEVWRYFTIQETPHQTGVNSAGTPTYGPSGAAVWSAPAINPLTNTLYFGTSQNYSFPTTNSSDSIIALNATTGQRRWINQLTPNDRWNVACDPAQLGLPPEYGANCPNPSSNDRDYDFGSSVNVFAAIRNNRIQTLVGAGQKGGIYHALDAQTGAIVWQRQLSIPTAGDEGLGGIQWGTSWDANRLYVATNQANPGKLFALNPATGAIVWTTANPSNGCTTGGGASDPLCKLALPAAVSTTPGVVYEGSVDGKFRAYNSNTGAILWQYDTKRSFTGTNGVTGSGGSINGAGASIVDGIVYINSGYQPYFGAGMAGNVLLAFGL